MKTIKYLLAFALLAVTITGFGQTMIPLPNYGSPYTGNVRGYWFVAPTTFVITGVRVPPDANSLDQYIHLVKFNSGNPPAYAGTTNDFTTLGYWQGVPGTGIIPTNVLVQAGDVIGVVGSRNNTNMYATPAGTFTSSVFGQPMTLTRLLYQGTIISGPAPNFSSEAGGSISRIELYYAPPSTAPNDAAVTEIISPTNYCSGTTSALTVKVANYGTEQLDSCMLVWDVNGLLDSAWYTVNLDTFSGVGSTDTIITIDSLTLGAGALNIAVYSKWPNGMVDTVNNNDTSYYSGGPSLSGNYIIGSSVNADFATFTDFADSLALVGVCGPVIVDVEDGTYSESVSFTEVPGMNSTNTVTIRGENNNNALAVLTSSSATTLTMNGADYFAFEDLTIENTNGNAYVIQFNSGSDYNRFEDCYIRNNDSTSTSTLDVLVYSGSGTDNNYNKFYNNTFKNGSYALYWYGTSTAALEMGNEFIGNEFLDQYYMGAYFYYQLGVKVSENIVHSHSTYTSGYGLRGNYCDNGIFTKNHIYGEGDSPWPLYGLYVYYSDATSFNNPIVVSNNIISIGDTNNTSSTYYGLTVYYSNVVDIVHNTVILRGGSSNARNAYLYNPDFGRFANNILANYSGGMTIYEYSADVLLGDNNVYYTNGTTLFYRDGNFNELSSWQAASNEDLNSLEIDPNFNNLITGTHCNDTIDNIGTPIVSTPDDFNGIMRSASTPDPGAYEFYGLNGVDLGPDTTLCQAEYILTVGDSNLVNSVTWMVGTNTSTAPTYVVSANNGSQTFAISASVSTNCGSASDNVNITLVPPTVLDDSTHICAGESVSLSAGGGPNANVLWFPTNETTNTISISSPGFYSVTKVEDGCESSASTIVTQSEGIAILDVEPCEADLPVALTASIANGTSYSWSGGNTPSNATNTFDATGDYAVTATDAMGCVSTDSFSIEVINVPTAVVDETHAGTVYFFSSANSSSTGSNASYLWQFGDGGTSNLANPSHTYNWSNPSAPAQYTVTLTITNDCGTDSKSISITPDVYGIADINSGLAFDVYPNPASASVNIDLGSINEQVTISIIDIAGRVVSTETANSQIVTISTDNLANGSYTISVTSKHSSGMKRIVINK